MPIQRLEVRPSVGGGAEDLALLGGRPVRTRQWPKWPRASASTQRNLLDVLHSTKWTLSGQSEQGDSYERRFARAFSTYCGVAHAVPCGSGSAGLTIALQALEIGPGDEVVLPGLAWVACAAAIRNLGATPVPADVDPASLCMTAETARAVVSTKTRAILAVHLYSARAPMPALALLAREVRVPLIEDASHAHGAVIAGARAGTWGTIGVFSMQQSKLLTAGEGGLAVTDDRHLYERMQQFRADGRVYARRPDTHRGIPATGPLNDPYAFRELVPRGDVLGRNLCLSEFHAAILLDRLDGLDRENAHRRVILAHLSGSLSALPGLTLVGDDMGDQATHYRVCIRLDPDLMGDLTIGTVVRVLQAELRLPVEGIDPPLDINPLFPASAWQPASLGGCRTGASDLPVAAEAMRHCLTLPHWCLLGDARDAEDIVEALDKVLYRLRDRVSLLAEPCS